MNGWRVGLWFCMECVECLHVNIAQVTSTEISLCTNARSKPKFFTSVITVIFKCGSWTISYLLMELTCGWKNQQFLKCCHWWKCKIKIHCKLEWAGWTWEMSYQFWGCPRCAVYLYIDLGSLKIRNFFQKLKFIFM